MGRIVDGTPLTINKEPSQYGYIERMRIVDRDGHAIASCFYIEGRTLPLEAMERWAKDIVTAINMHDRLVAFVEDNLPNCMPRAAKPGTCDGCDRVCEEGKLLKEARGDK